MTECLPVDEVILNGPSISERVVESGVVESSPGVGGVEADSVDVSLDDAKTVVVSVVSVVVSVQLLPWLHV